jgi:2-dehydropantoate 2-reductase
MPGWPRIAVLGAGAVGCYFGGMLARAGAPVTLIGRAQHVEAIAAHGLVIEWADRREIVRADASTNVEAAADADVVLVCAKSPDTQGAARSLSPHVRRDAAIVSLQNGVDNADKLRDALDNPVFAAVVYVGTSMNGAGIVRHAGRGDLVLGAERRTSRLADADSRRDAIAAMFVRAGVPCAVTADIAAALWTKLVINCAFNAVSALGTARYGRMARLPPIRNVMERAVAESVAVANASGVALDERSLIDEVWKVADALAGQHSSTAQDIVRGKPTEIDSLNGFVVARGESVGIDVPVNRTLHALVKLRESGDDLHAPLPPGARSA